jgi:hypothetical protein
MAQVPPDPVNPDPRDVADLPIPSATVNINATVHQIIQNVKAKQATWLTNANLPGAWVHPIRILKESGNAAAQAAAAAGYYQGIKNRTPKKTGQNLQVNSDARDVKRQTIAYLRQQFHDNGLDGQFRSIVRICPLKPNGNQDDSNCGCGCAS